MRLSRVFFVVACAGAAAFGAEACSGEATESGPGADAGSEASAERDGATGAEDASTSKDSALEDAGCNAPVPSMDGGGGCGTMEFGAIAAPFSQVDAGDGYVGGTLAAGIYDAVSAERASLLKGSWRETFVVDGKGRFTRIRQLDFGAGSGPNAVTRTAGTYETNGKDIKLTYDCAEGDGGLEVGDTDTLPYSAVTDVTCDARYRYGASGFIVTLKRR